MARMGVFSRQNDTPDNVPRSLQLLSYRNTLDARYMEMYPNYTEILYPNESLSINVTNFVRSLPMKRPQLSRVRVYQKFVAVPIRLLWSAWEDYIKGENDADFLYTEPYVVNFTDSGQPQDYDNLGRPHFFGNIAYGAGRLIDIGSSSYRSGEPTSYGSDVRRALFRGIVLDANGHVPDSLSAGTSELNSLSVSTRRAGYMCGIHELGDYLFHPIGVTSGKFDDYYRPFSAFKFAAYQLAYSYFERSPNVQTRVDDFFEMAQDDNREYPRVISYYDSINGFTPPDTHNAYFAKSLIGNLVANQSEPGGYVYQQLQNDLALSDDSEDKLRTTWEYCEKFPLKSGANMSMLASQPDPVTGLPRYVPSNISLFRKRFANWQTDYFTSCNPWPQRGEEAKIPVSGSITVNLEGLTATFTPSGTVTSLFTGSNSIVESNSVVYNNGEETDVSDIVLRNNNSYPDPNNSDLYGLTTEMGIAFSGAPARIRGNVSPQGSVTSTFTGNEETVSLSGSSSASVSGLYVSPSNFRFAMTLQHIKEMQAEIDNRYQSYIRKFFGARARDYRLDRPEFLGGSVMELNVSDVTQTSQSTDDSLLGDLAGKSVSAQTSRTIRYHADEHTVILGYIYIQPDTEYISGLNRIDSTRDRFDWALPQFSHLSEQAVYNYELAYNGLYEGGSNANEYAFGYQPVLNHLRWRANTACGAFRDTLNQTGSYEEYKPWISVRDYGIAYAGNTWYKKVPTLSDKFLSGRYNRDNSNFDVVDDNLVYPFMVDSFFKVRAVRTISTRGTPSRLG